MSRAAFDPTKATECERGCTVVISCEHAGNDVPEAYRPLFRRCPPAVLESHRGWDAGALAVARALAQRLRAPLFVAKYTRLLVDLNRSLGHPRLFSEFTRALSPDEREHLINAHYLPYRRDVENEIEAHVANGAFVLHVSVHSFTPVLEGIERRAHAALLYDPRRPSEAAFAKTWQATLRAAAPADWIVRRNYPYRGTSDGLTTYLRRRFAAPAYAGVELEINQKLVGAATWPRSIGVLTTGFEAAVRQWRAEKSRAE